MKPIDLYEKSVQEKKIEAHPAQREVMLELTHIYERLIIRQTQRNSTLGKIRRKIKPRPPVRGLYLWGSVGAGKTFLMDCFYECVPVKKMRVHFHAFMQDIQNQLTQIQGEKNPLQKIAKGIAENHVVICFDEFFVTNITDAMILAELFQTFFERGLCLIATSNLPPSRLYENGLQRERFLPAIALLQEYTSVFNLDTGKDFRKEHEIETSYYFSPIQKDTEKKLQSIFDQYAKNNSVITEPIRLYQRLLKIVKTSDRIIWFDFIAICGRPRSQKDYLALVENYDVFIVSHVPVIQSHQHDLIVSLINLIDVLYDRHKKLIISADAKIPEIYPEGKYQFAFQRTQSRLTEMQDENY